MASTNVRSSVPCVCLKWSKGSNYHEKSLVDTPGGYTGRLVGSYQCLVKTVESLLHSFGALLQLFKHFDILLLLLAGFLAL